jgi:hypothetical protein
MAYLWDVISMRVTIETAGEESVTARPPYLARQLSVLRLVLTLTSEMHYDQSLDGRC